MIVALEEAKYSLLEQREKVAELGNALRIDELREKATELEKQTYAEDFWNDQENSSKILQQVKQLKDKIEAYDKLSQSLEDAIVLAEMAIEENDESCVEEVQSELDNTEYSEDDTALFTMQMLSLVRPVIDGTLQQETDPDAFEGTYRWCTLYAEITALIKKYLQDYGL